MLGSVVGMALSTAIQFSVTRAAVPNDIPEGLRSSIIDGTWQRGDPGSDEWESDILDAKMKGIRAVFIMLVPLLGVCLLGCYFIPNKVLKGDQEPGNQARESARDDPISP
jgi:hypothetical protein